MAIDHTPSQIRVPDRSSKAGLSRRKLVQAAAAGALVLGLRVPSAGVVRPVSVADETRLLRAMVSLPARSTARPA